MKILARYQNMAVAEILSMIPASEHERIKATDPNPLYKAFVVGHEGDSSGKVIGSGTVVARWFKSAIQNLAEKIQFGLKIFHDHRPGTNDHDGRTAIGEVVGKGVKVVNDLLSAIAVVYIKKDFRHLPLDVASIEANVNFNADAERDVYSADVQDISGIALGNSSMNKPGFPGATLLAQVQAFVDRKYTTRNQFSGGNMTIEEIRDFLKSERSIKPSDLFGSESLLTDPSVKGFIDAEKKSAVSGEYAHRKRDEEGFEKKKLEFEKTISDLTAKIAEKDLVVTKTKIPALFEKAVVDRKLTDQQKRFIAPRIERFNPSKPEAMDAEFVKFLDDQVLEFKTTAEVFGIKIEGATSDTNPDPKKTGSEPAGGDRSNVVPNEMLDPSKNPMIPKFG